MLQGYAPDQVIRIGYIAIGVAVACLLIIGAILIFVPSLYGWPDAIAASVAVSYTHLTLPTICSV